MFFFVTFILKRIKPAALPRKVQKVSFSLTVPPKPPHTRTNAAFQYSRGDLLMEEYLQDQQTRVEFRRI